MSKERSSLPVGVVGAVLALIGLVTLLGGPSVANIRTVDMVHLIATVMGLGAALVAMVLHFVFRGRSPG